MKVSLRVGYRRDDPVSPLDGVLRDCREMGYDGIELMVSPSYPYGGAAGRRGGGRGPWASESVSAELRERLRESAARHGVEIATLSADWAWGYAQYNPRLSQWDRGAELLRADVDLAADLGARAMLMHVGESQGSWEEIKGIVARTVERAARREVRVGFEAGIFARTGLGGLEALIKLVDELDTPWFGVYEHCRWPRGELQPHEEIRLVGQRMVALHSSALNVQIDYGKMLQALQEVGYDGYWVFEVGWDQAQASIDGYRYLMRVHGSGERPTATT
ncbi:MAG TPA: sugar phosphate isomerase/epimerase family protein [Chloroflexota bacterium]|nr:sugar phosphate isomerase/epimerase family protein [Chloroflexota bacterium]